MDLNSVEKYFEFTGIKPDEYSLGTAIEGGMCLVQRGSKWLVFDLRNGTEEGTQEFPTSELACFHLYGVLAERHIDAGTLVPANRLRT